MAKMMMSTQRGAALNVETVSEFRVEVFADRSVVLRAAGTRANGGYFDRAVTPRVSREVAFAEAARLKAEAPVVEWGRGPYGSPAWVPARRPGA